MRLIKSMIIAISMFSKIPMPRLEWDKESSRFVYIFFPVVGIVISAVMLLWKYVASIVGVNDFVLAAGFLLIPVSITGGIHLDGYTDISDAISSYGDRQKRLDILKDPHIGAFAAIRLAVFLIVRFAFFTELKTREALFIVCLGFVVSRALSGLAAVSFKNARKEGTLFAFSNPADKATTKLLLFLILIASFAIGIYIDLSLGIVLIVTSLLVYIYYYFYSKHILDGITGDFAGWFLELCESWILIAAVVFTKLIEQGILG